MSSYKTILLFVFLAGSLNNVACQNPSAVLQIMNSVIGIINMVKSSVYQGYQIIGQRIGLFEGCEDFWIPGNIGGLEDDLYKNVYGQPLAIDMIVNSIKHHLENGHPRRGLILSFHGDPGTGKNFVSKKILENMFRKGKDTDYVHFFRGSIDFPSRYEIHKYKEQIINIITGKIYECHRSVFVFDEVEKMPPGILDVLNGLIKQEKYGDYDYRRAIFILLSNIGQDVLMQETLNSIKKGQAREDMDVVQLSKLLQKEAYNAKGGLEHSSLIKDMTISYYIPFLPLERSHIVQCMKKEVELLDQIMSKELENQVLQELTFRPDHNPVFAYGGCKIVPERVQFFITRQLRREKQRRYRELEF